MSRLELRRFLEVCHEGPTDLEHWCEAIAPALTALAAPTQGLGFSMSDGHHAVGLSHTGRAAGLLPLIGAFEALFDMQRLYGIFRVVRVCHLLGLTSMGGHPALRPLRRLGMVDSLGASLELGSRKLVMAIPMWEDDPMPAPPRRQLLRLHRHLSSGARRIESGDAMAGAHMIMDDHGRVAFSTKEVAELGPQVSEIAKALARDLGFSGEEPDAEAERLFEELWAGGWSIQNVGDTDGKRFYVLRRRRPSEPPVTHAEAAALRLARDGAGLKAIACELGSSLSTASSHLQNGLAKLGLRDRIELLRFAARPEVRKPSAGKG